MHYGDVEGHAIDVLVVEDNAAAATELVDYLTRAGLKCKAAGDAWTALKLLADGYRPDVVVTDLNMPELTGLEFADRLNHFGDEQRPEIILLSGQATFDDAIMALRAEHRFTGDDVATVHITSIPFGLRMAETAPRKERIPVSTPIWTLQGHTSHWPCTRRT